MSACIWSRSFPIVFLLAEKWFDDGKNYTETSLDARKDPRSAHRQTKTPTGNEERRLNVAEWSNTIYREAV
jgi:hypothetical protein